MKTIQEIDVTINFDDEESKFQVARGEGTAYFEKLYIGFEYEISREIETSVGDYYTPSFSRAYDEVTELEILDAFTNEDERLVLIADEIKEYKEAIENELLDKATQL